MLAKELYQDHLCAWLWCKVMCSCFFLFVFLGLLFLECVCMSNAFFKNCQVWVWTVELAVQKHCVSVTVCTDGHMTDMIVMPWAAWSCARLHRDLCQVKKLGHFSKSAVGRLQLSTCILCVCVFIYIYLFEYNCKLVRGCMVYTECALRWRQFTWHQPCNNQGAL